MIGTSTEGHNAAAAEEQGIIRTTDLVKVYPETDFRAVDELSLTVAIGLRNFRGKVLS
ncbi:MAG TPA: hypothetical protein VGF11_07390 [Acidimicrobiales bacterium]